MTFSTVAVMAVERAFFCILLLMEGIVVTFLVGDLMRVVEIDDD